jgi:dTDP-4-dehydrorhamnose reductase
MERRILVIGGSGQLGTELLLGLAKLGTVLAPAHQKLDLTRKATIARIMELQPTHVVHTAGATDVERCEIDPSWAHAINVEGTRRVAEACCNLNAWLLYVSTDEVFDGRKAYPYVEADPPSPLNAYGRSKLAGEQLVPTSGGRWAFVRTAWLYGRVGRNFITAIMRKLHTDEILQVVSAQVGSPSYAVDLAEGIRHLVAQEARGV